MLVARHVSTRLIGEGDGPVHGSKEVTLLAHAGLHCCQCRLVAPWLPGRPRCRCIRYYLFCCTTTTTAAAACGAGGTTRARRSHRRRCLLHVAPRAGNDNTTTATTTPTAVAGSNSG